MSGRLSVLWNGPLKISCFGSQWHWRYELRHLWCAKSSHNALTASWMPSSFYNTVKQALFRFWFITKTLQRLSHNLLFIMTFYLKIQDPKIWRCYENTGSHFMMVHALLVLILDCWFIQLACTITVPLYLHSINTILLLSLC